MDGKVAVKDLSEGVFLFSFSFFGWGGGTKVQEYLSKNDVPIELLWSKINRLSLGFVY